MIKKSTGVTPSEILLANLCDGTFLSTWSYANPYNEERKEFCDLIAVFEDHMFIFFDRERNFKDDFIENVDVHWQRWYREVVGKQTKTCHGAERYIRKNGKLFLDNKGSVPFPIKFDKDQVKIHKILVANGAKEACRHFSGENVNGSLGINYSDSFDPKGQPFPFSISIDRQNPVHVFDSHNLPILLQELDTFQDFVWYIEEKEDAIKRFLFLSYCGEEDLLAHYLQNFDPERKRHFLGVPGKKVDGLMLEEGDWNGFLTTPAYKSRKKANEKSYFWDMLTQETLTLALEGRTGGNSDIFNGTSALYEMAKEPRLARRMLSQGLIDAINSFPDNDKGFVRKLTCISSYIPTVCYVFLQVKWLLPPEMMKDFREVRQRMLQVACGATKNKFPILQKVIGIAMEPPKFFQKRSQDFILLQCSTWTAEEAEFYREENEFETMRFFLKDNLTSSEIHVTEFPDSSNRRS